MKPADIKRYDKQLRTLTEDLIYSKAKSMHQKFYCPILLIEEETDLCRGHIVSKSVGGTKYVIQRKDVDEFFGHFVEADFALGVKLREQMHSLKHAMEYILKVKFADKIGLSVEDEQAHREPIRMMGEKNGTFSFKYAKSDLEERPVSGVLHFNVGMEFQTVVSCLHSVHLGLFDRLGYAYVSNKSGSFIASMLGDLFRTYAEKTQKSERKRIRNNPNKFPHQSPVIRNTVRPLPDASVIDERLLENSFDWFHVAWDGDVPFATIHYLKANNERYAVMIYTSFDERSAVFSCGNQPILFEIGLGHFLGNGIEVSPHKSRAIWPCGENAMKSRPAYPLRRAAVEMRVRMTSDWERPPE